jgi:hypothetical protein
MAPPARVAPPTVAPPARVGSSGGGGSSLVVTIPPGQTSVGARVPGLKIGPRGSNPSPPSLGPGCSADTEPATVVPRTVVASAAALVPVASNVASSVEFA